MNPYLQHLTKLEFVVTDACTGQCKHCSQGAHAASGERIDPNLAVHAVKSVAQAYPIQTVLTFGGEPLLHPDAVCAIMQAAKECGISKRQVITNGYFSRNAETVHRVIERLVASGVNDLRLSVDAFHQETIPFSAVRAFAEEAKRQNLPIRLQPAWLVSPKDSNPYNHVTRELLDRFSELDIPESEGNVIFPEGNARTYLAEYFQGESPENPYLEDPKDVRCLSFSPNGDVLNGNAYQKEVMAILRDYAP